MSLVVLVISLLSSPFHGLALVSEQEVMVLVVTAVVVMVLLGGWGIKVEGLSGLNQFPWWEFNILNFYPALTGRRLLPLL